MKYIVDGKRLSSLFGFHIKDWKFSTLEAGEVDNLYGYDYLLFEDEFMNEIRG